MDAQLELRLLYVLHLEFAKAVAVGFGDHQLSGAQTDGEIAHRVRWCNVIRDLADHGGARRLQFGLDAKINRAFAGAVKSLPTHLPGGAQDSRRNSGIGGSPRRFWRLPQL